MTMKGNGHFSPNRLWVLLLVLNPKDITIILFQGLQKPLKVLVSLVCEEFISFA